jgi:hypothetical protein
VPARRARLALACFSHALASPLDVASLDDGARAELERASMEAAERVLADGRPLSLSSLVLAGGLDLEGARRAWSYCLWAGLAEGGPGRQAP